MEEVTPEEKTSLDEQINLALKSTEIPKIYANGFISVLTISDIAIILRLHEQPVAVLSMSYTTAKTLYEKLGSMIRNLEDQAETEIMTTDKVREVLSKKDDEK